MASRSLAPILRRSVATARTSSKALRGGTPPMPAFARIPAPSEPVRKSLVVVVHYMFVLLFEYGIRLTQFNFYACVFVFALFKKKKNSW